MCSKIHACAFHRQGRNNRSQMDLFNWKVLPNLQRSLWISRTSGQSLWRYIKTKLACYRLFNQKWSMWKILQINFPLSACLPWSSASWFSHVLPFVWFRLCSSFFRSLVHPILPCFIHSFARFVCSFCFQLAYRSIFDDVIYSTANEEKALMIRIKFLGKVNCTRPFNIHS